MSMGYGLIGSGRMGQGHACNLNHPDGCGAAGIVDPEVGTSNQSIESIECAARAFSDCKNMFSAGLRAEPLRTASAGVKVNQFDEACDGRTTDIIDSAHVTVHFENGARCMLGPCLFAKGSHWQEVFAVTGAKARMDEKAPGTARCSTDGRGRAPEIEISHRAISDVIREELEVDETVLAERDHHGSTVSRHQRLRHLARSGKGMPEASILDGLWSVVEGETAKESARMRQAIDLRGAA